VVEDFEKISINNLRNPGNGNGNENLSPTKGIKLYINI
jgi:hypothetical protein